MAVTYQSTKDPRKAAQNDRDYLTQRGDVLNQKFEDQGNEDATKRAQYEDWLNATYQPWAAGQGGYSQDEQNGIMQRDALDRLQNFDHGANYLSDYETQGMLGDTGSYGQYFDPDAMSQNQDVSAGRQRQAADNMSDRMRAAIDQDALRQSEGYRQYSNDTLRNTGENVRGAINNEMGAVRGAIDPEKLTTSDQFLQGYNMSPEEQQDIVTGAGISEGTGYRARMGDLARAGAAAGASPTGIAAMQGRMERESAGAAGDAMTQARIKASEAAAGRKLTGEQLRRSGEQSLADLRTGTELQMGQQTAQNEQALGQQALNQQNEMEKERLGAEQYRTGANLKAAETGGQAEINAETAINNQNRQQQQFNAEQGFQINQARDVANAQRAADIAKNRQTTTRYNQEQEYGRGMDQQAALSQRTKTVADQRKKDQDTALGFWQNQNAQANQNNQNDQNRQLGVYGTQSNAQNAATGNQIKAAASEKPAWWERALQAGASAATAAAGGGAEYGGVYTKPTVVTLAEGGEPEYVGALDPENTEDEGGYVSDSPSSVNAQNAQQKKQGSAFGKYGRAAASGMASGGFAGAAGSLIGSVIRDRYRPKPMQDGCVVTQPTVALVGENGPEVVAPLNKANPNVRPSLAMQKEKVRRPYGAAA